MLAYMTPSTTKKEVLIVSTSSLLGWKMGFEPTTFGTTIRNSNQLSYIHHLDPLRNRATKVIYFLSMCKFFG